MAKKGSTLVIGDVHGCRRTLKLLLKKARFDSDCDRLWMVGDLVNRGPDSLGVLRWAQKQSETMGDRFACVLGNHDLYLLALDAGVGGLPSPDLLPILRAPDRRRLIKWLQKRPFIHHEKIAGRRIMMVHAGLWPSWTAKKAIRWSERLSRELRKPKFGSDLLSGPKALRRASGELAQLGHALYAFTNLRTLNLDQPQSPCSHKGPVSETPDGCAPWFEAPERGWTEARVVFGHWAALGLYQGDGVTGLDSGCAWGGHLSALRLQDDRIFQVRRAPADAG